MSRTSFGGRVIYQRKKTVANEIRPPVFASVAQSVFLEAASKTDVASKTDSLKSKNPRVKERPLGFFLVKSISFTPKNTFGFVTSVYEVV